MLIEDGKGNRWSFVLGNWRLRIEAMSFSYVRNPFRRVDLPQGHHSILCRLYQNRPAYLTLSKTVTDQANVSLFQNICHEVL